MLTGGSGDVMEESSPVGVMKGSVPSIIGNTAVVVASVTGVLLPGVEVIEESASEEVNVCDSHSYARKQEILVNIHLSQSAIVKFDHLEMYIYCKKVMSNKTINK